MNWENFKEINWKQLGSIVSSSVGIVNFATKIRDHSHENKKTEELKKSIKFELDMYSLENEKKLFGGIGLLSYILVMTFAIGATYFPVSTESKIWSSAIASMSIVSLNISSSKKKKILMISSNQKEL